MSIRKVIFWLHLIAGAVAGIVILIMSVTGVLLAYERQINEWFQSDFQVTPQPGATRLPAEELLAKVASTNGGPAPSTMTLRSSLNAPAVVSYGREKTVFIDPYTGAVLGEGSKKLKAFFTFLIDWHRWLGMQNDQRPIGKAITGACNMAFLFLVISGFYLWWPRKWNLASLKSVTWFKGGLEGKARDWNWHNVIGFWSAIPLFFVVSTATFFSYPWVNTLLYRATGSEPPPQRPAPSSQSSGGGKEQKRPEGERRNEKEGAGQAAPKQSAKSDSEPISYAGLEQHVKRAEQEAGWKSLIIRLPTSATSPVNITVDRANGARPDKRLQMNFDRKTGEIISTETYEGYNLGRRIRLWVRWVHTGEAGGFIGQTIAMLASAGGAVLVWTGIALALRRLFSWRSRSSEASSSM